MKNISSEVDYLGKSDVCCDGNSLFTLVTGVGNTNFDHGKVDFSINLNVMATSELFADDVNENDALNVSNGLKEADAAAQNGVHYPNGVLSAKQQLAYTCTWPGRPNNNHYNLLGKYRSVGFPKSDPENACANHNGHQTNCADHDVALGGECLASRKIMVRSASMDNLESADVYALKSQQHVVKEVCQVSGIDAHSRNKSREDLSALNRRSSEPLNMIPPRPLNSVLESIPLAYNPKTKQLHLLKPNINSVSNKNYQFQNSKSSDVESNNLCAQAVAGNNYYYSNKCDAGSNADNAQHHHALLQRVSTCGSLQSKTDYSSFSSISSLCTDVSVSTASAFDDNPNDGVFKSMDGDDSSFIEINLNHSQHHRNRSSDGFLPEDPNSSEDHDSNGQGVKSKRRGLTGFLSRNLLAWRSSRDSNVGADETPGWKFFGKTPPRTQTQKDPNRIIEEYHERQHQSNCIDSTTGEISTPRSKRSDELVASSTTALILENRPSNLPSKAPEEEVKHRLEYQQMVEAAKKKEIKEAKLKKKLAQQQLRHEEQLSLAAKCWNAEILPNWETEKVCRKAKKLWWQGIPPSVRGKVWKLAIGNDLHITPELYEICVCRAKDRIKMAVESISVSEDDFEENLQDKESSVELIKLDVSRTFPQLCIFQKRGPCYDMLHSLLGAYVCYRPDVGYVQGMSFLAAVLILNLEVADAFICFANLMNKPCQLAFFRLDEQMMKTYFTTYEEYFCENLPKLYSHFSKQNLTPDLYLIDWIYTLYSRSLPLDVACRVWDVYFRDGDEFLFRTALGILRLYDDILLNMEFIHLAQFLTKLPEDIGADQLFKSIESIRMVIDKRSYAQVLQSYSEPKQT